MRGMQIYYLYRYVGSELKVSPLPQWQVESYNYRTLASACLSVCGTLPPIEYAEDGALVHLRLNYLLPPRELAFLKLYSWPETCTTLPFDFKRKMSKEVFEEIKQILSDEGYEIKRGDLVPSGANSVHKQLRTELEDYIKSQYFGKSPILLSALSDRLDDEGLLYQKPFIESLQPILLYQMEFAPPL